ncbi:HNH endonuclease signature motif containing protein [Prosthecobacter sp. SYSU 5D2]|uniref:HNH endonuclease n=1 Tax=Prosthecobacter sp. SYSU 5D2 TaxID=3134134 RepID=UPI0031FEF814
MSRVDSVTAQHVRSRGVGRCEYCRFPEVVAALPFQMDHIIAQKHDGPSDESNLAFACYPCNSSKGPNIAGIDPVSGEIVRLFHPRQDVWKDHFAWKEAWLFGITNFARATIQVLNINAPEAVALRESLLEEGFVFE